MTFQTSLKKIKKSLKVRPFSSDDDKHSRYEINKKNYQKILIHNVSYIFTCNENDKLEFRKNHSIVIEGDTIKEIVPASKVKREGFDLVYDAGKRGGTVVTPGLINTHSHIHMYLLRSAMMLDERETVDETIASMAVMQKDETEDSYSYASIGDITEQQKNGITTTLTHGPSFESAEIAARVCGHNLVCAVSAVSNSRPTNTPEMVEKILEKKATFQAVPAISLHYLYKASMETLLKVKKIVTNHNALLTFHMAESPHVVEQTRKIHGMREVELLEITGLLNQHSIASHALYVTENEIKKMAEAKIGIAHLPTSNTIHQSGLFQFWPFAESGNFPQISLGTDSVVSKNRLDILTEAYQARITHLYSRTIKFGSLFKMMTANGARILNMPDRVKVLSGMKADLVFWKLRDRGFIPYDKENPTTLIGNLITHGGRMVRDTMINGKFVIRDRRHQLVNETELLDILQKKHMQMRRRVKKHSPGILEKKSMTGSTLT
jgi:cytosine/adenosine deaminase-related metal-dependent hydrolase